MRNLLKEKGLKQTMARLAILKIFTKNKKPIDAETISKKLRNIDPVTVYRTIHTLEKSGILTKVDLRKDSVHFEIARNHHHHIICTNCEKIEEFSNNEIEKGLQKIASRSRNFINITAHSLELFGLCGKCA